MMNKKANGKALMLASVALVLTFASFSARAQDASTPTVITPQPATSAETPASAETTVLASPDAEVVPIVVEPTIEMATEPLALEVRKGIVVRLPRPATTIFVADPNIADVQSRSPTTVYVFGKRAGETSLYVMDESDLTIMEREIRVTHDLSTLSAGIAAISPDSSVRVRSVNNLMVIEGDVKTSADADAIRNLAASFVGDGEIVLNRVALTTPSQVNLRVRFAEVSRDALREIGINWRAIFNPGNFTIGILTGGIADILGVPAQGGGLIGGGFSSSSAQIDTLINLLEDEGILSILAEPNLTAISGETASFLAGGEFPIPIDQDNDSITVEFKEFGVSLSFTPTVIGDDLISMRVRPEVSQLSDAGAVTVDNITIPALTVRRADTTVELTSGQTFAIAGLLSSTANNSIERVPGLSSLPVLGPLFQSRRFQRNETELVILVTPYLVKPVAREELTDPTQRSVSPPPSAVRMSAPTSRQLEQLIAAGGTSSVSRDMPRMRIQGPVGFILE